jgi:predicted PurR-regulated permease PerM
VTETKQVEIAPRSLLIFVLLLLGAGLLVALISAAREILVQLLAAIVLAMALEPVVQALQRRRLSRSSAVGVTFGLAAVGAIAFGWLLFPPLVQQLTSFARDVPNLLEELTQGQGRFGFLENRFHIVENARAWVSSHDAANAIGAPALHVAGGLLHTGASVVTVAFLALFVGLSGHQWFDAILRIVPEGSRERWRRVGLGISKSVGGYVFGNLLISVIAGAFTTAVLLATRVPYPVPLGLIVAAFDLVPLVGATIGAVIVGAVALTKGLTITAIVLAAMWLYQKIENNVLVQLVYHRTVNLSPLAIAVSVAAGAEIGGIAGALFAIPVAGALKIASRELLSSGRGEAPMDESEVPRRPRMMWRKRSGKEDA